MSNEKSSALIIGINFFPEPTGIGKYTSEFAFALAEKGFQVDVITSFPYYPQWKVYEGYKANWYKKERIHNVNVTRCPFYVPSSLSGAKRMLQDFSFFLSAFFSLLKRMISGKTYSLIFIASPSFLSGFLGLFYKFFYRKAKFVYHIQDLQVDAAEELGMINNLWLLKILKKGEGLILKHADYVTTISKGMAAKIKSKPFKSKQLYLFPNWVNFENIYRKQPDVMVIEKLGFPLNKKLVFYSGAVGEKQGLEMVLQAAKLAIEELPGLVFVIAGSGPYANTLKQQAAHSSLNNLFFIDLQPIAIFNELLNYASFHLVIQKDKAGDLLLPSKLTNILAVGGIAIVTAAPGTSLFNIIHENKVGIVIPPDNADFFWKTLVRVNDAPIELDNLKTNASNYARQFLEKDNIINSFLFEIALSQSKNSRATVS